MEAKTDGHGNKLDVMTHQEFLMWASNKEMHCSGDTIEVRNSSGCVIQTIKLKDKELADSF